jgi:3-phosphoshikimate 1-carboxyvinyltransferase
MARAAMTLSYTVQPGGRFDGAVRVPGDKSVSHRSIILGSIASGTTHITGFLEGEDALATMNIFRALGVKIEGPEQGKVTVQGVGLRGLRAPEAVLDCGNSGTSMRLLAGLHAPQSYDCELTVDATRCPQPMRRVAHPLSAVGARIDTADGGRPPLRLHGNPGLHGIDYVMPVASAQVKSSLLLAGLYASGTTRVTEPAPTRDHTERMLTAFGYSVQREGGTVAILGGGTLRAADLAVPADISSAAFFMVGATIASGSEVTLRDVGVNPTRTGAIEILRLMGADLALLNSRELGGEPVADIRVRSAALRGIEIPRELVPLAIDEFPALFVAAANARGRTVLRGAEELRVKESDRIQVMADGLAAIGAQAVPTPDGMIIDGGPYKGGVVDSSGDHRIAMAFAMAATGARGPIIIRDCANVATSFPGFVEIARGAGLSIEERA